MALKSYGSLEVNGRAIVITKCEPHVSIKLKSVFHRIPKGAQPPYTLPLSDDICRDMIWFMVRYPFLVHKPHLDILYAGSSSFMKRQHAAEELTGPNYEPKQVTLKAGSPPPRKYQLIGREWLTLVKQGLIADDIGLGKTLVAILGMLEPGTLPAAVVMQTHMQRQWQEQIERFTTLRVCKIKSTKPYPLPRADVYLFKYSQLAGWVNYFELNPFKYVAYDEIQELRHMGTQKYGGGVMLSQSADWVVGLSATPVFNYGDEIFNIMNLLRDGCLGERYSFIGEWCSSIGMNKWKVDDTDALGTYLREANLVLRRSRKEVGRELPKVNTIIENVGYDEKLVASSAEISKVLANKILYGSGREERGQAALEFDVLLRHDTGISKAIHVAAFVRMLLENGEKVILGGWHRDVYEIWLNELKDFNPVMYTGSESTTQKDRAKDMFCGTSTNLLIISLRSGAGLDGLQFACSTVVVGELDWSPQVHAQLVGRVDRDGQRNPVTAFYMVSDYGSDPPMVEALALKSSQAHGIMNPGITAPVQHSDESRVKRMAEWFLKSKG